MLKPFAKMLNCETSDTHVQEDCSLFLKQNLPTICQPTQLKLQDKCHEDMQSHTKLSVDSIRGDHESALEPMPGQLEQSYGTPVSNTRVWHIGQQV